MNADQAYKTVDGIIAGLALSRKDHVVLQSSLGYLYEQTKELEESKKEKKDE